MSIPAKTERPASAMKEFETMSRAYQAMMPKEFAGAVNLMAHPMAGAAAAGALGLGAASHAFGLWMGAVVGTAEASRRALSGAFDVEPAAAPKPAALKLVEKAAPPAPEAAAVPEVPVDAAPEAPAATTEPVVAAEPATPVAVSEPVTEAEPPAPAAAARPIGLARPEKPDDLKAISGIGPKLEKVLNDLDIWTFDQIAALSAAEIAWLDDYLGFSGRIGRDDWLGQAKRLVGAKG